MAYINKKDFSILDYVMDTETIDDYFMCDDMIAPTISLLNRKGYKTNFCCSGHPFPFIDSVLLEKESDAEPIPKSKILRVSPIDSYEEFLEENMCEEDLHMFKYYAVVKNTLSQLLYISFEENYEFSELPEGIYEVFDYDDGGVGLYMTYTEEEHCPEDAFEGITMVYEANKKLYEWAKKLPSLV